MGRKIDKKHRLWIKSRAEELLRLERPPTLKVIAERLSIHISTLATILEEDGRTVERQKGVKI